MIDYLIVGSGIAGICFAETCIQKGKTFRVWDNNSQNSSTVAGGVYNPVILKRFSKLEGAQEQLVLLQDFFASIEKRIDTKINFPTPILRKFFSAEEQNNWFIASDKVGLSDFLSTKINYTQYNGIESPFGYGEVLQTGYIDTALLVSKYKTFLKQDGLLIEEGFHYDQLLIEKDHVGYNEMNARHIVFAEGFGIHANPFFNFLPLAGTKGELLVIKAPDLKLDVIVKGNVFLLPIGNHLFKVGATYNWDDKTNLPTAEGREELVSRIKEILHLDFEVVDHYAGIRPTVKDRKPLLGTLEEHQNVHVFNGLGTRGVMLGPSMALTLFDHIENGVPLNDAINIKRFERKA